MLQAEGLGGGPPGRAVERVGVRTGGDALPVPLAQCPALGRGERLDAAEVARRTEGDLLLRGDELRRLVRLAGP
jgi:hypothetical protein